MVVAPGKRCQEEFGWRKVSAVNSFENVSRAGKALKPVEIQWQERKKSL